MGVRFLWTLLGSALSAGAIFCILQPFFQDFHSSDTLASIVVGGGLFGISRSAFYCGLKARTPGERVRTVEPPHRRVD